MFEFLTLFIIYVTIIIPQFYLEAIRKGELRDDNIDDAWHGMWFPLPPDYHFHRINETNGNINATKAINFCDNGKDNIAIDYDPENKQHSYNYLCLTKNKKYFEPNVNITALLLEYYVPPAYVPSRKCLNETLHYKDTVPTFGAYRPIPPRYGTYRYLPPQRWLHSLADGAIVLLYHPCACNTQVKLLKNTLRSSIYRHIISPSLQLIDAQRPMALLSWGKCLKMSVVDERVVLNFIKENAKHGAKSMGQKFQLSSDTHYDVDLVQEAHLLTDELDNNVFDMPV